MKDDSKHIHIEPNTLSNIPKLKADLAACWCCFMRYAS